MSDDERLRRFREGMESLYRFSGYGPISARLWICGVEERGDTAKFNDDWVTGTKHEVDGRPPFSPTSCDRRSPAWQISFNLARQAFGGSPDGDAWAFADTWKKEPELLHLTNIFVVPRQTNRDWNLKLMSRNEFIEEIRTKRVAILRKRRPPTSVVVCHHVPDTRDLGHAAFVKAGEAPQKIEASDGTSFNLYPASRTILSPFFRNSLMTSALFARLVQEVRTLLDA